MNWCPRPNKKEAASREATFIISLLSECRCVALHSCAVSSYHILTIVQAALIYLVPCRGPLMLSVSLEAQVQPMMSPDRIHCFLSRPVSPSALRRLMTGEWAPPWDSPHVQKDTASLCLVQVPGSLLRIHVLGWGQ